jgi:hypothetical protein
VVAVVVPIVGVLGAVGAGFPQIPQPKNRRSYAHLWTTRPQDLGITPTSESADILRVKQDGPGWQIVNRLGSTANRGRHVFFGRNATDSSPPLLNVVNMANISGESARRFCGLGNL